MSYLARASDLKVRRTRHTLVSVHRWLGLAAGLLWLLQAATGALIVFHWEEDDATISARHVPTDLRAIGRSLNRLAPPGSGHHVSQVWTSAGFADRYDVMVVEDGSGAVTTIRVSGDGTPIRVTPPGSQSAINTVVLLHQSLLAGTTGRWIIGASGLLLLSHLVVGAVLAWPKKKGWARVLRPPSGGPVARYYGWHRALGLMGVAPALVLVSAGVLLAYDGPLATLMRVSPPTLPARPGTPLVEFDRAVLTALRQLPGSKLAAVELPTREDAIYRVHLRAPGEWRRAYGNSLVFIDARSGRVVSVSRARDEPPNLYWFNALAPTHTGEAFGMLGRIVVLCTGLWLATMILIGSRLWWLRRRRGPGRDRR